MTSALPGHSAYLSSSSSLVEKKLCPLQRRPQAPDCCMLQQGAMMGSQQCIDSAHL